MASTTYRLPRCVVPLDYDVALQASPRRSSFSGVLVLSARVVTPTTSFELNAIDLAISDVGATVSGKKIKGRAQRHPDRESVE